jgi:hypothetical protein
MSSVLSNLPGIERPAVDLTSNPDCIGDVRSQLDFGAAVGTAYCKGAGATQRPVAFRARLVSGVRGASRIG